MIQSRSLKQSIPYIISILFAMLFLYAAVSKLLDYDQFKVQLQQSNILMGYANTLVWIVPLAEIVVAFSLLVVRYRRYALYACLGLVILFTAYILLMLNFSETIPCSCIGVMPALGWTGHLYLNLTIMVLTFVGLFYTIRPKKRTFHRKYYVVKGEAENL